MAQENPFCHAGSLRLPGCGKTPQSSAPEGTTAPVLRRPSELFSKQTPYKGLGCEYTMHEARGRNHLSPPGCLRSGGSQWL